MEAIEALERRVRVLELRQRQFTLCCVTLAIGLAVSIFWRVTWVPREISARRFVLKDSGGGTRGQWGPTDVSAGEINGETQHASKTCLVMGAATKTNGTLRLCAPWDGYGGPSLVMSEKTGASLHVVLDAYTVSVLGRTSPGRGDRGALVLGVWQDKASIQVSDKEGHRAQLRSDGMLAYDPAGAIAYQTPGTSHSIR